MWKKKNTPTCSCSSSYCLQFASTHYWSIRVLLKNFSSFLSFSVHLVFLQSHTSNHCLTIVRLFLQADCELNGRCQLIGPQLFYVELYGWEVGKSVELTLFINSKTKTQLSCSYVLGLDWWCFESFMYPFMYSSKRALLHLSDILARLLFPIPSYSIKFLQFCFSLND